MSYIEGLQTVGKEAFSMLVQFYEYDRDVPLDAKTLHRDENEAYIREKIVFRGLHNNRIPGYLTLPALDSPPYPGILMAHGMGGSKEDGSELGPDKASITKELLSAGFAVLALDAPYHGERTFEHDYEPLLSFFGPNIYREFIVQWTVEYRLAIDYLSNRQDINSAQLGMLGYSLGGVMAFNLLGVDPRIKAAVTGVTLPISRYYISLIGWDETALAQMAPMAPQNFAPAIKSTPFLMLNGKTDPFGSLKEVQALYELIASPTKALMVFDSGHALPEDHMPKVAGWFRQYLK